MKTISKVTENKKSADEIAAEEYAKLECEGSNGTDTYVKEIFLAGCAHKEKVMNEKVQRLIEALEKAKTEYWNKCYQGSGTVKSMTVNQFDDFVDQALENFQKEG